MPVKHFGIREDIQGYLPDKKTPPPWDHYKTLGITLLKDPRERRFLMNEGPLYRDSSMDWIART